MFGPSGTTDVRDDLVIDLDRGVVREREPDYDAATDQASDGAFRSIVDDDPTEAIADLGAAIDRLSRSQPQVLARRRQLEAYAELERLHRQLDAQKARLLETIRDEASYTEQAAVSVGGWLKQRLQLDPTIGIQRERVADRLRYFDQLRAAWQAGDVDAAVVHEVCKAAIPQRRDAIVEAESALVLIGRHGRLGDLRRAIAKIRDLADPDGTGTDEQIDECRADPRRQLNVAETIDGLTDVFGTLDQLTAEALQVLLDAYMEPDPPDTPDHEKRTAAQRRHDAFATAIRTALDFADDLPDRQGRRPHLALFCDLNTLLGRPSDTRGPWLRHTGDCEPALARHLALDATITPILGNGQWRPVALGRAYRVAPAWLRHAIEWIHRHCRGPGCDRPTTWTQAAHTGTPWAQGGETNLDEQMPGCQRHHELIDVHGWNVHHHHDTNTVTWTSPDGHITIQTRPPPDLDRILRNPDTPQRE